MSGARLVITAVTVEKRPVSEVARSYGVARSWIYTLLARYRAEGDAAFEPRSRRPKASPRAISADTADVIIRQLQGPLQFLNMTKPSCAARAALLILAGALLASCSAPAQQNV